MVYNKQPNVDALVKLLVATFVLMLLSYLMASCSTTKSVESYTSTHDTVVVTRVDTAFLKQTAVRVDSFIEKHDTLIVLNSDGSVNTRNITNTIIRKVYSSDSLNYYKSMLNDVKKSKSDVKYKTITKEYTPYLYKVAYYSILPLAVLLLLCFLYIRFKK